MLNKPKEPRKGIMEAVKKVHTAQRRQAKIEGPQDPWRNMKKKTDANKR